MSKLSFRARALDASKPMPIYMAEELPDLPDYSAINRAVPQMPSGMEKEEECEHHLQRAICAGLIIPTPEVSDIPEQDAHDKLYPANYKQPRQLIHMQPFTMEQDIPDYDMDSEDERWLEMQAKKLDLNPLKFEEMMDRLEKSSGQTVVTLQEAKALLKEDDDLIIAVFDYWLNKRLKLQHPLILAVKTEHRAGTAVNNPYLAFRRRTEKMQTRKNRKNDETSYEKMLKLRRDLSRAVTLLELVKRREKMKREYVHLTVEVFEKRYQAKDFSGAIAAEVLALKTSRPAFTPIFHNHYPNPSWSNKAILKDEVIPRKEKRQYKKRKHKSLSHNRVGSISSSGVMDGMGGMSSDEEPVNAASPEPEDVEEEGQFAFRRNKLCSYHMPLPSEGNWPWCSKEENGLGDKKYRYAYTSLLQPTRKCIGFARRRMGRGGRVILDRLSKDIDDFWKTMDYTVYDSKTEETTTTRTEGTAGDPSSQTTDSFTNLGVDNAIRTDINCEPSVVRTCGGSGGEVVRHSSDDINTGACETGGAPRPVQPKQRALPSKEERDEMLEILQSARRDWLHFRPKTPPPDYSPYCGMLPADEDIFDPCANNTPPFSLELRPLDPDSDVFADPPSGMMTSPFLLDYDVSVEVPVTDTRQAHEGTLNHRDSTFNNTLTGGPSSSDDGESDSGGAIGCSRFSVSDCSPKRHCIVSSTLTSPKLNNVLSEVRSRTHNTHTTSTSLETPISNANGIVSQYGIESGNTRSRNNKLPQYGYSRSVGNASTVNNLFGVHTSAPAVTLNSANILEIPMSNDTDGVSTKGVVGQCEPGSASPNSKTKTIVRKNNLAMEVT